MTNDLIKVAFPKLNKTCCLEETDYEISKGYNVESCKVERSISVSDAVYNRLGIELMDNGNEMIWGYIGGHYSDDPRLAHVEHPNQIFNNPELKKIFTETMYALVTEVVNKDTGDKFYVNTEGYGYARYTGRAI